VYTIRLSSQMAFLWVIWRKWAQIDEDTYYVCKIAAIREDCTFPNTVPMVLLFVCFGFCSLKKPRDIRRVQTNELCLSARILLLGFIYLFLFNYSHVYTLFGSFLPLASCPYCCLDLKRKKKKSKSIPNRI
jgi:hypothetical protein